MLSSSSDHDSFINIKSEIVQGNDVIKGKVVKLAELIKNQLGVNDNRVNIDSQIKFNHISEFFKHSNNFMTNPERELE